MFLTPSIGYFADASWLIRVIMLLGMTPNTTVTSITYGGYTTYIMRQSHDNFPLYSTYLQVGVGAGSIFTLSQYKV